MSISMYEVLGFTQKIMAHHPKEDKSFQNYVGIPKIQ